jgi:phosphatidate cytidylyltransferase
VTRILSALVLLPLVLAVVLWLPSWATLALASAFLLLGMREYGRLAAVSARQVPIVLSSLGALSALVSLATPGVPAEVPLLAAMIVLGSATVGLGHPEDDVLRRVAIAAFPMIYLGLPLGAIVAVRDRWGALPLLAMLFTVMASDIAQFYGGRALGRRKLAPSLSPKKTVEGAIAGFVAGACALPLLGQWWLPALPAWLLGLVGATLVALGIVGDLFESLLKRSAGVKDASSLIPGHGGVLDRLDSLLFAGPVYYVFLRYAL